MGNRAARNVAFLVLVVFCLAVPQAPAADRPNIVILYADDMGYGDLGIQNPDSKIPTPHLDQLAREGTRFTDAHSSSGICTPSRYALLTGRYHWRKFHNIVNSFEPSVIDAEELTLPEMLRESGYRTACIGKWHLGWDWQAIKRSDAPDKPGKDGFPATAFDWTKPIPDGPLAHGFDSYFGDDVPNFPPYAWIENDRIAQAPTVPYSPQPAPTEGNPEGRPGPMVAGWQQDQVMPTLTRRVVAWIAAQKGGTQPFFLYFPWTSPHAPIVPAKEFQGSTSAGGFGDFMHQSDWTAGQVLRALDENGFRDNTLVIFSADNGPEHYAYDRIRNYRHRSMGPLRGLKRDIWEGGHRVPLVVRWPGVVAPGAVSSALVSQIDLMATIAAVVDYQLPPEAAEDSHDLLPLWQGQTTVGRHSMAHNTYKDHYAVRADDWVLIDAPSGHVTKVPAWFDEQNQYEANPYPAALYHIREDLGEHHNLFATRPEKVAELRELLQRIRAHGEVRPGPG